MRLWRKRPRRRRYRQWIGSYQSWTRALGMFMENSRGPWSRHDEPYAKREEGRRRRETRSWRIEERYRALNEGDMRCTHLK